MSHALTATQLLAGAAVARRLSRGRVRRPALRAGPAVPPAATVSAVVPARDEERRLAPCLRGLLTDVDLIEVLVVDDCSTDVSFALASAAEHRGEAFDEAQSAPVSIEHYVPAPA